MCGRHYNNGLVSLASCANINLLSNSNIDWPREESRRDIRKCLQGLDGSISKGTPKGHLCLPDFIFAIKHQVYIHHRRWKPC